MSFFVGDCEGEAVSSYWATYTERPGTPYVLLFALLSVAEEDIISYLGREASTGAPDHPTVIKHTHILRLIVLHCKGLPDGLLRTARVEGTYTHLKDEEVTKVSGVWVR